MSPREAVHRFACLLGILASLLPAHGQSSKPARSPAPPPPLDLPVTVSFLKETKNRFLGYYIAGTKSGWGSETMGPATIDGKPFFAIVRQMTLEMKGSAATRKVESLERRIYAVGAPFPALLIETLEKSDGQEKRVVMKHSGGSTYTADITEAGKTRREEMKNLVICLSQETTPALWASDPGRKPGDVLTSLDFSCWQMKMRRRAAVILRPTDWTTSSGTVPVWEMAAWPRNPKDPTLIRVARSDGRVMQTRVVGSVEYREEPEQIAKTKPTALPDLFRSTTIAVDRKLGKAAALTEVVLTLTPSVGKPLPDLPNTAHQTIEPKPDGTLLVRITRAPGKSPPVSLAERAIALTPSPRYPLADDSIKKLAAQAIAGAKDDASKVASLITFTGRYLQSTNNMEPLTVLDLLKSRKGDCTAYALLFTTLARAAGIPSREAGGWLYMGDSSRAFGGHAWSEVILDGRWVAVDPVWNETRISAGHLQLISGTANGRGAVPLVTGLKAQVLSFKTK